jgi:23S rRNA (guanosine2251-2'-O)-methyltransferase
MGEKISMDQLGRISAEEFKRAEKIPVIVVLDHIRSGLNVGSIFRSADAFRIQKIICCGYTPVPPHREVLKSALGATESVDWSYEEKTIEAIAQLKLLGCRVVAIEQTTSSIALNDFKTKDAETLAIVLGNEVQGVDAEVISNCDGSIEVTQYGTKHSLNVAVCAGIVLYDLSTKMRARK